MPRKRRCDRAYLIYKITCTVNNACYVGMVVRIGQAVQKTLARRLAQHLYRARTLGEDWELHRMIRLHGPTMFVIEHLETVHGKAKAHVREVELMGVHRVTMNTSARKV